MLSSSSVTAAPSQRAPPTPLSHQPHFQHQLRLSPTRHSSEPLSLVSKPVPVSSASPRAVSPVTRDKVSPPASATPGTDHRADSEPLSLVNKAPETPENLSKKPTETDKRQMMSPPAITRPEVSSIRVRPAEALSPLCQPPLKKTRQSPSPRLVSGSQKPPTASSPALTAPPLLPHFPPTYLPPTSGYRPGLPPTSTASLPPTSIPGLPPTSVAGLPPTPLASLYSPYSPYLSALAGHPAAPGAPGPDLWAAQAAHLMALGGLSPAGYPHYPPGLPSLPGYPPSLMPPSFPGAPSPLPGLLPPHLLAPPPHTGPPPPAPATPPTSLPLTVGGASQFMCSWMQGRDYCGRRFNSSEELMSHLRTHTANMGDTAPASSSSPAPPPGHSSALDLLRAQAAQLRGPVSPPPSSLSPPSLDPRLHPYLRPGLPQAPHPSLSPVLASLYGAPRQLPVLP